MSGIICYGKVDSNLSQTDFEEIATNSFVGRQSHQVKSENTFVLSSIIATPGSCASKATCKESRLTVMVDGYFIQTLDQQLTSAEWFLNTYKQYKDSCFGKLNGSYNILIIDEESEEITLVSDRYGTRPLVYAESSVGFAISYSSDLLVGIGVIEKKLNENLVANALSFSRVWYNDETFYQGVKCLKGGSILKWSKKQSVRVSKFPVHKLYQNEKPSISKLASIFKEVISDFQNVPNLGISLSGGLDSRILLASGFSGSSFTWGYRLENDEIQLAKQCADTAKIPWSFIQLTPEDFLDINCQGDLLREGLDLFVQSYGLKAYQEVSNSGITGLMTGLALDATLAGSYNPKHIDEASLAKVKDFAFSRMEYFDPCLREKLLRSSHIKSRIENIESEVTNYIVDNYKENNAFSSISDFFFEHRVRRCIFQRQFWQRAFVEDYIPTFDNRLVDYIELFSLEERTEHKVFRELLLELNSDLADIDYQGTNIPPSVPVKYWAEATRLEQEKETLTRKIFFESKGKCYVPYNRYYSNFDEWLRVNESWKNEVQRLLLSDDSLILNYLNKQELSNMIKDQFSGASCHYGRIVVLMSLEKTLRLFS